MEAFKSNSCVIFLIPNGAIKNILLHSFIILFSNTLIWLDSLEFCLYGEL